MMKMEDKDIEPCRIISIEAKDIFGASHMESGDNAGYSIRSANGELSLRKFTNTYDWSLDSMKLSEAYEKETRRKDFSFRRGKHQYTKNVICVTFKYSYKLYNKAGKNTYIRSGYNFRDCVMTDGVCVKDGTLIAIQTNVQVNESVSQEVLGGYFTYSDGFYEQSGTIPTIMDKSALRNYLYEYGFVCDGVEYVRYKRSSGSSRVGKCLFVNKILAERMNKWDRCGLTITDGMKIDLAAWEAYISLPMSSIIDTMEIQPESILVIDDYESVFNDEVIAVEIEKNKLAASQKNIEIHNSIWDGQSLLDESLFEKYPDKGMLLLRNRFFKTCAFNTKLQKWFSDNNICDISQLNGFTTATDISQIKMITTKSSIKYAKFGTILQWLHNIEPVFGIVKYEKETHYFDGRMVQSHYQLFNTLQLSYSEIEKILKPSLDYISAVRRDPDVLRYHIGYPFDIDESNEANSLKSKNEIVFKLLGINNQFAQTKMYYDFRDDLVKGFIRNLKQGHVLLRGNYSTLFGNGAEMLMASIGKFDGMSVIGAGNIHSTKFEFGKMVLGSRSPHITMGNVLLVRNVDNQMIETYFNLTNEIVCVNAIGENIQQRLNGCDYDSDTILLTDNAMLIEAAMRNYNVFKVPTSMVSVKESDRFYTNAHKADLDVKTSVNKIGEIVNLSQQLNSLLWHRVNSGKDIESCMELYFDICKLAVLSGVEIDKAKKEFVINSTNEIAWLKQKYKLYDDDKTVKPLFFKMITLENGYALSEKTRYKPFGTSMDYLQKIISLFNFREARSAKKHIIPFMDIVKAPPEHMRQGYYYSQKEKIISTIREAKEDIRRLYVDYDTKKYDEKEIIWRAAAERKQTCIEAVDKLSECPASMYLTLKEIDNKESRDVARFIFEILFGKPNEAFFTMIADSKEPLYKLVESSSGTINYYDFHFEKTPISSEITS